MLYLLTININSANFVIFLKQKCFLSFAGFNAKHVCAINNTKEAQRRNTGGTKKLFFTHSFCWFKGAFYSHLYRRLRIRCKIFRMRLLL